MPCLFVFLIVLFPRVALALLFFFTRFLEAAFHNNIVMLILGFVFLPLTTLVYAWMVNGAMPREGINLLYLLIAVILDLGLVGGSYRHHRSNA